MEPLDLPNVSCIGCDYPLRGLMPSGACPECGTLIADSIDDWNNGGKRMRAFERAGKWIVRVTATVFTISIITSVIAQFVMVNCADLLLLALGASMRRTPLTSTRYMAEIALFFLGMTTVVALSVAGAAAFRAPGLLLAGQPISASAAPFVALVALALACVYGWLFRLTWIAIREDRALIAFQITTKGNT